MTWDENLQKSNSMEKSVVFNSIINERKSEEKKKINFWHLSIWRMIKYQTIEIDLGKTLMKVKLDMILID